MSTPSYEQFKRQCANRGGLTRHQVGEKMGLGAMQTTAFAARLAAEMGEQPAKGTKKGRMVNSNTTKKRSKR
jgi:hypothetical protein